ncbi:MAG: hypothetical protein HY699_10230 [Deltaproteobacteria bacterium]|nr:hypothetical protein [Deltaproteobacteria bacterium]
MSEPENTEIVRIRRERNLYMRLLHLGRQRELEPFLREALALIVDAGSARQGYLELYDDLDDTGLEHPRWWIAGSCHSRVRAVGSA